MNEMLNRLTGQIQNAGNSSGGNVKVVEWSVCAGQLPENGNRNDYYNKKIT